ncbi:MAG: lysozyme inhibitor LprI family protein [Acinetobacter sp.]
MSRQYSNCMDRSGGVTVNMLGCIAAETSRQDTRLNNAYKRTMASLNATRKKQLQEVQRLWMRYRDANCKFYADPDGGTIAAVNSNSCYMEATAARATELENLKEEY